MKRFLVFLFLILATFRISAQEMWGISNSNFSGNMGIFLNPSTIVAAPYKYEFNLLAADNFAQNTYIYIPKESNLFIRGATGKLGNEKNYFDIYNDQLQTGFAHVNVIRPSYIRNLEDKAWGIHTAYRHEVSAIDVPPSIVKFIYEKYNYEPIINRNFKTNPFSADWLSWGELGGTYGKVVLEKQEDFLKVAATVNLLAGFDGMFVDAGPIDFTIQDSSTVIVHNMETTIGHAADENGNMNSGSLLKLRGFGASTTLGATYIHHRNKGGYDCNKTADKVKKYDYRIGFSLMDLGFIRFFNDARMQTVQTTTDRTWTRLDTTGFISIGHLDSLLSSNITGNASSTENKSFSMYLPTAISLQFDYSFTANIYGNVSWVNRIYYSAREVARGNQLGTSVRYERRRGEVAVDFTLFEYSEPSVGIGVRYGILVLGTDRILELFGLADAKSFDVFFGIKMGLCDIRKKAKSSCPAFGMK